MPNESVAKTVRARQRLNFMVGAAAAGFPILCQVLMALVIKTNPKAFPQADLSPLGPKFWCVQVMLVCVAVAGNTIIDFSKHIVDHSARKLNVVVQFLVLVFFFIMISIFFAVTMLDRELSWTISVLMVIFGLVDLLASYRVDMAIALAVAGEDP